MKLALTPLLAVTLAFVSLASAQTNQPANVETLAQRDARMAWFRDAKFGMFIHWGVYAVPAGTYKGEQIKGGHPGAGAIHIFTGSEPHPEHIDSRRLRDMELALNPPAWRLRRWSVIVVLVAGALWALLLATLWWGQEWLLFRPSPLPADHRFQVSADVHETWVDVPGARLNALHLKLPDPAGVVFYLHGNGSNLQGWFINPAFYRALNLDLFMVDYRGYGKSSGRIASEAQLLDDMRTAWQGIAPRYAGKRRVFLGRSLGSGLAAQLAAEVQPELTLLVSPYASMQQLAAEKYPWVPAAVLRYPLRSDLALPKLQGAVVLVHGELDTLIPPSHSERLRAVAERAKVVIVPAAAHGDVHRFESYQRAVSAALARP